MLSNLKQMNLYSSSMNNYIFGIACFRLNYKCQNNFPYISIQKVNHCLEIRPVFFNLQSHMLSIDQCQNTRKLNKYYYKSMKGKTIRLSAFILHNWFCKCIDQYSIFWNCFCTLCNRLLLDRYNYNNFNGKFSILEQSFHNIPISMDIYYLNLDLQFFKRLGHKINNLNQRSHMLNIVSHIFYIFTPNRHNN